VLHDEPWYRDRCRGIDGQGSRGTSV